MHNIWNNVLEIFGIYTGITIWEIWNIINFVFGRLW